MNQKFLRLDYFRVYSICSEKDEYGNDTAVEMYLNLDQAFTDSAKYSVVQRELNNKAGERIRIQKIQKHNHNTIKDNQNNPYEYWELEILRERTTSLPGISKPDGSYDPIEVEDGERICEDVTALYDPKTCIILIYRKREALSPAGIEDVLNRLYPGNHIVLRPLLTQATLNDLKNQKYFKSIDVSVIDDLGKDVKPLTDALKEGREIQAQTIHIHYGIGKGKSKKGIIKALLPKMALNLIEKYFSTPGLQKLVVKAQGDADDEVKEYDLINERMHDIIKLQVDRDNPVTHDRVFKEMEIQYFNRYEELEID